MKMKKNSAMVAMLTGLVLAASIAPSQAWLKVGVVMCDANTNGIIDGEDLPVPGVLVVVTNISGTFSNASWTRVHGEFAVSLPEVADSYVDYIRSDTLPLGTINILPAVSSFVTDTNNTMITNSFLLENPGCVAPPPPTNNLCWLTGGGTIRVARHGQPQHTFGGVVNPGCSTTAAGGGNWNDVDHAAGLHFKGLQIDVVTCGNVPGYRPGSRSPKTPYNYIDFEGVGRLTGVGGNHTDYGFVTFYARCEDHSEPGHHADRYYLRVTDADDNVLMLISADPANPMNIAPVPISTGNLQMHVSGCDKR